MTDRDPLERLIGIVGIAHRVLVRTRSHDSIEKIKSNRTKTWHYIFTKTPPHTKQNQ
jgi:hypothetical protein